MNLLSTNKTIYDFLSDTLGVDVWVEDSVPINSKFPYTTFTLANEAFTTEGLIQVRVFTENRSIKEVVGLSDKLEKAIGEAGTLLRNGRGYIWLYKGSPFAQLEPTLEENLKTVYINLLYRNV